MNTAWRSLKGLSILLGSMFALAIALVWAQPRAMKSAITATAPPISRDTGELVGQQLKALEAQISADDRILAAEKDELGHLNDLTKLLMTIAGVFTLLLGAASWKALDDQRRLAAETIDLQKENLDQQLKGLLGASRNSLDGVRELRDELQRDFPMFGRMRKNFLSVLQGLELACSRLEPDDDTYSTLLWDETQQILFYENAVTTALLLDTREYATQLSEIYRLLGVFYGSKYVATASSGDLHRSRFYFDRSIDFNPSNYATYMHAGHFTQYPRDSDLARVSRGYFLRATAIGSKYQKPWISISLIELEAYRDSDRAIAALEQARMRPEYDYGRLSAESDDLSYLHSCALCLRAKKMAEPERETTLTEAMKLLVISFNTPTQRLRELFDADKDFYFSSFDQYPLLANEYARISATFKARDLH